MKTFSRFSIAAFLAASLSLSVGAQVNNGGVASSASNLKVSADTLSEIAPAANGELAPYFRNMISDLKRNWKPSTTAQEAEQGEADVLLTIMPSGEVSEVHLEGVTHNQALNKSSWDALRKTTFAPLPNGMNNAPLKVRVHFIVA